MVALPYRASGLVQWPSRDSGHWPLQSIRFTLKTAQFLRWHPRRTQRIRLYKLSLGRPETLARWAIENLHRLPRGQQVSRKTACKNAEIRECEAARSTDRNEKPHRARGSAGSSPSQRLVLLMLLAETQGFEPWIQVLPRCTLSRGVPSTTRPRLRKRRWNACSGVCRGRSIPEPVASRAG